MTFREVHNLLRGATTSNIIKGTLSLRTYPITVIPRLVICNKHICNEADAIDDVLSPPRNLQNGRSNPYL